MMINIICYAHSNKIMLQALKLKNFLFYFVKMIYLNRFFSLKNSFFDLKNVTYSLFFHFNWKFCKLLVFFLSFMSFFSKILALSKSILKFTEFTFGSKLSLFEIPPNLLSFGINMTTKFNIFADIYSVNFFVTLFSSFINNYYVELVVMLVFTVICMTVFTVYFLLTFFYNYSNTPKDTTAVTADKPNKVLNTKPIKSNLPGIPDKSGKPGKDRDKNKEIKDILKAIGEISVFIGINLLIGWLTRKIGGIPPGDQPINRPVQDDQQPINRPVQDDQQPINRPVQDDQQPINVQPDGQQFNFYTDNFFWLCGYLYEVISKKFINMIWPPVDRKGKKPEIIDPSKEPSSSGGLRVYSEDELKTMTDDQILNKALEASKDPTSQRVDRARISSEEDSDDE
jgi:hypothetical protein